MNDMIEWLDRLSAPKRNHFFFGKMMGVAQFELEQRYAIGQRWLGNRLGLGSGVLCGLAVSPSADGKRIRLAPGVAVDAYGREIIVPRAVEYDPFAATTGCCGDAQDPPATAGHYQLCLYYRECSADQLAVQLTPDCEGSASCEADSIVESYGLSLREPEAATSFDCITWFKPLVPASEDTPATPPDEAELRKRLKDMLKGPCATPADGCVVLGSVDISGAAPAFVLKGVTTEGQQPLYSQAQLFDMIACLAAKVAACCGGDTTTVTPPASALQVTKLEFFRFDKTTGALAAAPPTSEGPPPVFPVVQTPVSTGSTSHLTLRPAPFYLRVSFNQAVDASTVLSRPWRTTGSNAIVLNLVDDATGQKTQAAAQAFLETETSALLTCPGEAGLYELTLLGDPTTANPTALLSWDPDPTRRQRLDGNNDNQAGGNYVTSWRLEDTETLTLVQIFYGSPGQLALTVDVSDLRWQWSDGGTTFDVVLQFNVDPDPNGIENQILVAGYPATSIGPDPNQPHSVLVHFEFSQKPVPGVLTIGISETLQGVDGRFFDGEPGTSLGRTTVLATGDGHAGGKFEFKINIG